MQPEWLTSTVTAFARCGAVPSSHSTRSFTLEIMRLWLLNCAQRSCTDFEVTLRAAFTTMCDLALEVYRGRGREFQSYCGRTYRVNSTFYLFPHGLADRMYLFIFCDLPFGLIIHAKNRR